MPYAFIPDTKRNGSITDTCTVTYNLRGEIMKKLSKEYYFELAVFLMDYHSGQWSRGYRLLSRLRLSGMWSSDFCQELRESEAYQWLVANYANKV